MKRGSLQTVTENAQRAAQGLQAPQYANIDDLYRRQLVELKTTEMVNSDLDKYHKACLTFIFIFLNLWQLCIIYGMLRKALQHLLHKSI